MTASGRYKHYLNLFPSNRPIADAQAYLLTRANLLSPACPASLHLAHPICKAACRLLRAREWLCPATERLACRMHRARGQPQHDGKSEATRHYSLFFAVGFEEQAANWAISGSKQKGTASKIPGVAFRPAPF
jgi:hypothetical protein